MNVTGHYEEFDKSNLNKEDLTSFDKIKQNIEKIKQLNDLNSEDSKKLEQQIQKDLNDWKEYLKDEFTLRNNKKN